MIGLETVIADYSLLGKIFHSTTISLSVAAGLSLKPSSIRIRYQNRGILF